MTFDFQKALDSAKNNPALAQFLTLNKEQFLTMTEQQITAIVVAYIGGDFETVIKTWFNVSNDPLLTLADAASMVANAADIAQRRYEAMQRAMALGKLAAQLIISAISAGVVL